MRNKLLKTLGAVAATAAFIAGLNMPKPASAQAFDAAGNTKFTLCDSSGLCVNTDGGGHLEMVFSGSLPAGSNVIGGVTISGSLPSGSNLIGQMSISNFPASPPTGSPSGDLLVNGDNSGTSSGLAVTGTSCPTNCVTIALNNSEGIAHFKLAGLSATGATAVFERSSDTGSYAASPSFLLGTSGAIPEPSSGVTASGEYQVDVSGFQSVRMRISVAGTGTITVEYSATSQPSLTNQPLGSNTVLQQDVNNSLKTSIISVGNVAMNMDGSGNVGVNLENTPAVTQSGSWNFNQTTGHSGYSFILDSGGTNVAGVDANHNILVAPALGSSEVSNTNPLPVYTVPNPNIALVTSTEVTTSTTTVIITHVTGKTTYIYAMVSLAASVLSAPKYQVIAGSGTNCGTSTITLMAVAITFASTTANSTNAIIGSTPAAGGFLPGFLSQPVPIPAGDDVCVITTGTTHAEYYTSAIIQQ